MITARNLSFDFSGRYLFKDSNFDINPGEKIGIVGRNGFGKSTLLKILVGGYAVSPGMIQKNANLKITFFNQDLLSLHTNELLYDVVNEAFTEINELKKEYEEILIKIEKEYTDQLINRLSVVQDQLVFHDGYNTEAKLVKVLKGLGFNDEQLYKPFDSFSGGWRMRAMLAKCLLEEPDVLLLDEPSNHLDLPAISWLEKYLQSYKGTFAIVSHNRHFLDNVCNKILEIDLGKITTWKGNYTQFETQKAEQQELLVKTFNNQQKKLAEEMRFIERFRYKASKASAVQSRLKQLEKMDTVSLPEHTKAVMKLDLSLKVTPGKMIYELKSVSKAYEKLAIFNHINGQVHRGDKIALVGMNGKGKSTLLRMIYGSESFEGNIVEGHNVKTGFFAQHQLESLDIQKSIIDEMMHAGTGKTEKELRTVLGAFLFSGEDVLKPIKLLSGGEKSRVALAKLVSGNFNVLFLDEPTNHLDMQSIENLADALVQYEGTLLCVSHDRSFIDLFANKIWFIYDNKLLEYPGTFEEFEQSEWYKLVIENVSNETTSKIKAAPSKSIKDDNSVSKNTEKALSSLESEITALEQKIVICEQQLAESEIFNDKQKSNDLIQEHKILLDALKVKNVEWEELYSKLV